MALKKDAYLALEDIVGPDYITEDTALLDGYCQVWGNALFYEGKFSTRPGAVLLPESTEQVQQIVRVCNRNGILFKPFSSGFENVSLSLASENSILIDLRRMDKIIDIDEKNCRAIVEPYVNSYRLQLTLAKHGLYYPPVCCGPSAGVVAASCAHFGANMTQVFTGGLGRNVLGVEWVLPNGELFTMGAAESGKGWFSGDGPGITMRGILRGESGANGGHGVITKSAVKCYPWYGPDQWQFEGPLPSLKAPQGILSGYKLFEITFPDEETLFDSVRAIGQAEVAFSIARIHGASVGEGNDEMWAMAQQAPEGYLEILERTLQVMIGAPTERAMAYKEKALLNVVGKFNGELLPMLNTVEELSSRQAYMFWSMGTVRETFRLATDFWMSNTGDMAQDLIKRQRRESRPDVVKYIDEGALVNPGAFAVHYPYENYSSGSHLETVFQYDPFDEVSLAGARKLLADTIDPKGKFPRYGIPMLAGGLQLEQITHIVEDWSPLYDDYGKYMQKIKQALDPNAVADWTAYVPNTFPPREGD
jgi:glycolate oxidase